MAEAVRRFRETGGSDVVRRLIARPIRFDPPRMPRRPAVAGPVAEPSDAAPADAREDRFHEAAERDAADAAEDRTEFEDEDLVERLQAEIAVMKAILTAERAEAEALRARIERQPEPDPIGAEARATRERWAGMVDRLLLSAR